MRSVRVTLPDGNAGNLQSVLYDIQESGVEIEVCIVPLCTPCLRDKSAEYLLEELEKTQCVHSLTDALYEFAKRRLHLAYPTRDGLSAVHAAYLSVPYPSQSGNCAASHLPRAPAEFVVP